MKTALVAAFMITLAGCTGCTYTPKAKPDNDELISIIKLEACGKPFAYFAISRDGTIHEAAADDLSKEQIAGVDAQAEKLPDNSAGQLTIPCVPPEKTSFLR